MPRNALQRAQPRRSRLELGLELPTSQRCDCGVSKQRPRGFVGASFRGRLIEENAKFFTMHIASWHHPAESGARSPDDGPIWGETCRTRERRVSREEFVTTEAGKHHLDTMFVYRSTHHIRVQAVHRRLIHGS